MFYSFAIGFVGAILFVMVDKYEPDGPMARLLKFLVLFVSGVAILHKLKPWGLALFWPARVRSMPSHCRRSLTDVPFARDEELRQGTSRLLLIAGKSGGPATRGRPMSDRYTIVTMAFVAGLMLGAFTVQLKDQISLQLGTLGFSAIMRCAATGP